MRTPKHPSAYADVAPILEAALAAGGGAYKPLGKEGRPSREAAIQWRHRVYAYRQAIRNYSEPGLGTVTTPYDHIYLQIDPKNPCVVLINPTRPVGQLLDLQGNPLEIAPLEGFTIERDVFEGDPLPDDDPIEVE